MKYKKIYALKILTIIVGVLVTYHIGIDTVAATSAGEPVLSEENFNWSPYIWAVIIIGGSIGITLTYVSWRKYKGEQKKYKRDKDKMID